MRIGLAVVVILGACARPPPPGPCDAARLDVDQAHFRRVHGLSQGDDFQETMERLGKAAACAPGDARVGAHVQMLRARLGARGQADELLMLARALGPGWEQAGAAIRDDVRQGASAARARLAEHARALTEPGRAQAAREAWDDGPALVPGDDTATWVNHVSNEDSCISVLPGRALPAGMAMFSVSRGGRKLALKGDSPAAPVATDRPAVRPLWLCTAEELRSGDRVSAEVGGKVAWSMALDVHAEAQARGIAVAALRQRPVKACGETATMEPAAKAACALAGGGKP